MKSTKLYNLSLSIVFFAAIIGCQKSDTQPDYGISSPIDKDYLNGERYNPTTPEDGTPNIAGYEIQWSDEFSGTELNTEIWDYEEGLVDLRTKGLQHFSRNNVSVKAGELIMTLKKESANNDKYDSTYSNVIIEDEEFPNRVEDWMNPDVIMQGDTIFDPNAWIKNRVSSDFTSASLIVKDEEEFKFKLGRIELRAKLPVTQDGIYPGVRAFGVDFTDNAGEQLPLNWPACGEISVMRFLNDEISSGLCIESADYLMPAWRHATKKPSFYTTGANPYWAEQYHIWVVEREMSSIKFYLDGVLFHEIATTNVANLNNTYQERRNSAKDPIVNVQTTNPAGSLDIYNPINSTASFLMNLSLVIREMSDGSIPVVDKDANFNIDYIRVYKKPEL